MQGERWSFGGTAAAVASSAGAFLPGVLLADGKGAVADGWWRPTAGRPRGLSVPGLAGLTAADDRGFAYALRVAEMSTTSDHPDRQAWPQTVRVRLDPAPAPGAGWVEIRGSDGDGSPPGCLAPPSRPRGPARPARGQPGRAGTAAPHPDPAVMVPVRYGR